MSNKIQSERNQNWIPDSSWLMLASTTMAKKWSKGYLYIYYTRKQCEMTGCSSFSSWIFVLPWIEFGGFNISHFNAIRAIYSSPVFGILAIVLIHFEVSPGRGGDFTCKIKPFWGERMALCLSISLFSSLPLLETETKQHSRLDSHSHSWNRNTMLTNQTRSSVASISTQPLESKKKSRP